MIRAHISEMAVEEVANALTHGFGLLLSVVGFIVLMALTFSYGDAWALAGSIVYGTCLVVLYAASTVYHSVITEHRKRFLRIVDHCCIYLLIAGTYTPFMLTVLRENSGREMLIFIWAVAIAGIAFKLVFGTRFNWVGIVLYLVMGWAGLFVVQPMYAALGTIPLLLVVGGGLSYTAAMIFFGWHRIKHHHAIFHIFILGGSILHYIVIAKYIIPR